MVRAIPMLLLVAFLSSPSLAQSANIPDDPIVVVGQRPASRFAISDIPASPRLSPQAGSRIIAGTELSPNAMIGFGIFGEKPERAAHAPATSRDLRLPKSRKAAVGFSLRF